MNLLSEHERRYIQNREHRSWPHRKDPAVGAMTTTEKVSVRYAVNRKDAKSVIVPCDGFHEPDSGLKRQRIGGNYVKIFDHE